MTLAASIILDSYLLVSVTETESGELAFCGELQEAKENGVAVSQLFFWRNGSWFDGPIFDIQSVDLVFCREKKQICLLGRDGEIVFLRGNVKVSETRVNPSASLGPFRKAADFGAQTLLLGGARDIIEVSNGSADLLHSDSRQLDPSLDDEEFVNELIEDSNIWFDFAVSVSGDIITVGSTGIMHRRTGGNWHEIASPTNQSLHSIVFVDSRRYICCGNSGVVMVGEDSILTTLDGISSEINFVSVCAERDDILLADGYSIYEYKAGALSKLELEKSVDAPSHMIRTFDIHSVSLAAKEVFIKRKNTNKWVSILN